MPTPSGGERESAATRADEFGPPPRRMNDDSAHGAAHFHISVGRGETTFTAGDHQSVAAARPFFIGRKRGAATLKVVKRPIGQSNTWRR